MSTTSATHSSCPANSGPLTAGSRLGRTTIKCFHRVLKIHVFKQIVPGDIRRDDLLVKIKVIVHPPNGLQYAGIIWSKLESDQLVRPNQIHDDTHDFFKKIFRPKNLHTKVQALPPFLLTIKQCVCIIIRNLGLF